MRGVWRHMRERSVEANECREVWRRMCVRCMCVRGVWRHMCVRGVWRRMCVRGVEVHVCERGVEVHE